MLASAKKRGDATVMSYWISECLTPYHTENRPALLMMDKFKAHLVKPVREELAKNRWSQLNLPANMTSRVQILLDSHPEPGKIEARHILPANLIVTNGFLPTRLEQA